MVELQPIGPGPWTDRARMTSVVAGGPGFIAGGESYFEDHTDAAVWLSNDGRAWARVESPAFGEGVEAEAVASQWISDVAAGPLGIVAVGAAGALENWDAAVWISTDGQDWNRVPDDAGTFGGEGDQTMRRVAYFGDNVIAVGDADGQAASWISADGATWTRGQLTDPSGRLPSESMMTDVVAAGPGLVAVGSIDHEARPAIWLSADGVSWSRVSDLPETDWLLYDSVGERTAMSIAASDAGLTAIGSSASGPFVWSSSDGLDWRELSAQFVDEPTSTRPAGPFDYLKGGAPITIAAIGSVDDRLFAVGGYETRPSGSKMPRFVTVWHSKDGGATWLVAAEWTLPPSDSQSWRGASAMVLGPSSLVLVGRDETPTVEDSYGYMQYDNAAAAWLGSIEDR